MRINFILVFFIALALLHSACARSDKPGYDLSSDESQVTEKTELEEGEEISLPQTSDLADGLESVADFGEMSSSEMQDIYANEITHDIENIGGGIDETEFGTLTDSLDVNDEFITNGEVPSPESLGSTIGEEIADSEITEELIEEEPVVEVPRTTAVVSSPTIASQSTNEELIPKGWPDYVPIMDGFVIKYTGWDEKGIQIVAFGDIDTDEVRIFYENLAGWELDLSIPDNDDPQAEDSELEDIKFDLIRDEERLKVRIIEENDNIVLLLLYTEI